MQISVGTFNLNNLFSRYNFRASVNSLRNADPNGEDISVTYTFDNQSDFTMRTFQGRLIKGKEPAETAMIAERILAMNVDVLAVQEVEDISVLKQFNSIQLANLYPHVVLVEGNDPRLIDVGLMSRYPIGAITSFQTATHPSEPDKLIFGRDLLAVEILDQTRRKKLFTLYNTHLKSHFVDYRSDPVEGKRNNDLRRQYQAEAIAGIISSRERKGSRFVLTGDMNDPVTSAALQPMLAIDGGHLINAVTDPVETRLPKPERQGSGPQTSAWSYRHNPPGADTPPIYGLYDQIWLSPGLAGKLVSSHIDRRTKHGGDGSDHDPVWVKLAL